MGIRKARILATSCAATLGLVATTAGPLHTAAATVIQPGSSLDFGGSFCTANFVYDGASGAVYIGAARHCTNQTVGQVVYLSTGSLGSDVERIGTVAYWSDALDFSLTRLDAGVLSQVRANMAGYPHLPSGVATPADVKQGDKVQFSGHGVGFDLTTQTQQARFGAFMYFDGAGNYVALGPVSNGDSGGPVADVTDGGKALGIVDTVGVNVSVPGGAGTVEGVALYALLADASAHGFPVTLRKA